MSELVEQNHFELLDAPAAKRSRRQQDEWTNRPRQHGHGQTIADADADSPRDLQRTSERPRNRCGRSPLAMISGWNRLNR